MALEGLGLKKQCQLEIKMMMPPMFMKKAILFFDHEFFAGKTAQKREICCFSGQWNFLEQKRRAILVFIILILGDF